MITLSLIIDYAYYFARYATALFIFFTKMPYDIFIIITPARRYFTRYRHATLAAVSLAMPYFRR